MSRFMEKERRLRENHFLRRKLFDRLERMHAESMKPQEVRGDKEAVSRNSPRSVCRGLFNAYKAKIATKISN